MTEKEVLKKLEVFKNAILTIKEENKKLLEDKNNLSDDNELLKEELSKKKDEIDSLNNLMKERMESSASKEDIKKVIEEISKVNSTPDDSLNNFDEVKESFVKEVDRLRNELDTKNKELSELKISKNKEIENLKKEHESSLKTLQDLYESELKNVKNVTDNILSENKVLKENNISIDRTQESLKAALLSKEELETKNKELAEKIKRLEEIINSSKSEIKEVKVVKRDISSIVPSKNPMNDRDSKETVHTIKNKSSIDKETIPYRFGRTSKTIMEKVDLFLDALFEGTKKDSSGITLLSDTIVAKDKVGLSDTEYNVFMDRFSSLDFNNTPLLWEKDGRYHTNFDKTWIKNYISSIM